MAQLFGVQMLSIDVGIENSISRLYFSHIVASEPYVHVFFDSCHMLSKEKIYVIVLQDTEFYYMGITSRSFGNLFASLKHLKSARKIPQMSLTQTRMSE